MGLSYPQSPHERIEERQQSLKVIRGRSLLPTEVAMRPSQLQSQWQDVDTDSKPLPQVHHRHFNRKMMLEIDNEKVY